MRSGLRTTLFLTAFAALLSGCYESPDVTRYEPGVYKGTKDPLLAKLSDDTELRANLDQRFEGQRDR